MSSTTLMMTLIPVTAGAVIGFVPTLLLQRRGEKHEIETRWDSVLLTASVELVTAARRTEHIADQIAAGNEGNDQLRLFDELHQQVRVAVEQMRMLGTGEVQVAARNVLRAVYSRRVLIQKGFDPYADEYGGIAPSERARDALLVFYKAVRKQLRVVHPEDVPRDSRPPRFIEPSAGGADQPRP